MEVCCGGLMVLCCMWSLKFLVLAGLVIGGFSFVCFRKKCQCQSCITAPDDKLA